MVTTNTVILIQYDTMGTTFLKVVGITTFLKSKAIISAT